jgi:hypothetical protein
VTIENAGTGHLNLNISLSDDTPWLRAFLDDLQDGKKNDSAILTVKADDAGLQPGIYHGTITINAGTSGSYETIGVELAVKK